MVLVCEGAIVRRSVSECCDVLEAKYPSLEAIGLGGGTLCLICSTNGGEASSASGVLSLLGGVLKGDTLSSCGSTLPSGMRRLLSIDGFVLRSFGFPALFIGGGMP